MSVRKRAWTTRQGVEKQAWVVDYTDQAGKRRLKTFAKKKEADTFASTASVEIREGTHVADSASATVSEAGEFWIAAAEAAGLERSTVDQYRQHLDLHIVPIIGATLLSKLAPPAVRAFEDRLRHNGRSPAMVRKIMVSLSSLLADAQERGLVARNVVRDLRGRRKRGKDRQAEKRLKGRIKVGIDLPTRPEIKAVVEAAEGRWRPFLITAIFTGLRASELRGLRWADVDFGGRAIHVRQRADRFNAIGRPKTHAGERSVPMTPMVANALKTWRLACPKGEAGLVFPNGKGKVESLANIINRGLIPTQISAGVAVDTGEKDEDGEAILRAKYTGMHTLRHWFASWCINRKEEGGLGLPAKAVQERLGHSSIAVTMDIYGHLFPRGDDAKELAEAEKALFA
jgi:integrase